MTWHKQPRPVHALAHLSFWGKWRVALLFLGEMP